MNARAKFLMGAGLLVGGVSYLMATGIKETGVYFLTPSELATKVRSDPSFHDVGVKMNGKVVKGTIRRDVASQTIAFQVVDPANAEQIIPVVYRGLAPDTFTDEVEVVVEGRLERDGTFRATTLLAKCGSRYEAAPRAT